MVIKVKMEPQAKSPAKKARSNRAPKTNEIANTPQKSKPKNTRKKAVQNENTNPAPPTAQQTAGQSKKKGSAVDDVEAPGDSPDHTALLARIRELEGEFDMLWNDESTKLNVNGTHLRACAEAEQPSTEQACQAYRGPRRNSWVPVQPANNDGAWWG